MKTYIQYPRNYSCAAIAIIILLSYNTRVQAQTYTKSGKVYEDYDANGIANSTEPGTNADGKLCAYLLNGKTDVVLQSQAVNADGSFSFTGLTALSNNAEYIIGIARCGIPISTIFSGSIPYDDYYVLPGGWSVTLSTYKWESVGNAINSTTNNFFIRRLPVAANIQTSFLGCQSSVCVNLPPLSGVAASSDPASPYAIDNYKIITVPASGTLKANGSTTSGSKTIPATAANTLCYTRSSQAYGSVTVTYVAADVINGDSYYSDPATYTIRLGGADFRRDAPSSILLTCNSQSTMLSAPFTTDTSGLVFTYSWTGPNSFSSNSRAPILPANTAVEDGLYIVTATDQSGCQSKDTLKAKTMTCFPACDGDNGYMIKGAGTTNADTLYKYNIPTGTTTAVSGKLTSVDALCFNIYNNLLYGWAEGDSPWKHIYAVDATGRQVDLGISADASAFSGYYFAGTCAPDGRWYMATGSGDPNFLVLDINPASPRYMRYAGTVKASGGTFDPWDFTWSECDHMIYGVSGNDLYQMNPVSGLITKFPALIPGGDGSYGAQFMDYNCNLYISQSSNGNVYRASLATIPGDIVRFTFYSRGPIGSFNDATISPVKPEDFGDAPASYGIASHKFNCAGGLGGELLYLGNKIDYEATPQYSTDAMGDDQKSTGLSSGSDEDGLLSYSPLIPCGITDTISITIKTYNNTGANAVLSGWIDFNINGLFDATERQQVTILNKQTSAILKWSGLNSRFLPASNLMARFRIGTGTQVDTPAGFATLGEVEDYQLRAMGVDQGDAPIMPYGVAVSYVFSDNNGDNIPDDSSAVWLGNIAQGRDGTNNCTPIPNIYASGDDNDGVNDDDGYTAPNIYQSGPSALSFTVNSNRPGKVGYYGIWIDWNNDGFTNSADEFYTGSFVANGPTAIWQAINVPVTLTTRSLIYLRFRVAAAPLVYSDYKSILINSETEDYFVNNGVLPITLTRFTADKQAQDAVLLTWQTSSEQNNSGFNVQHSTDGRAWQTIYFVNGAGYSAVAVDYSYVHAGVQPGIHYYRLQQLDYVNNIKTSATKKITISGMESLKVYPNPVGDKLYIDYGGLTSQGDIHLYSSLGQLIITKNSVQNGEALNVQSILPGIYTLKINFSNQPPVFKKIIKQ